MPAKTITLPEGHNWKEVNLDSTHHDFVCVILFTSIKHTSSHTEERFTTGGENEHKHAETNGIADTMNAHTATHVVITVAGK